MHNIHWAVIFTNGTLCLIVLAIGVSLIASRVRQPPKPKVIKLGDGSKVRVKMAATGETRYGTMTGVLTTEHGFDIMCKEEE